MDDEGDAASPFRLSVMFNSPSDITALHASAVTTATGGQYAYAASALCRLDSVVSSDVEQPKHAMAATWTAVTARPRGGDMPTDHRQLDICLVVRAGDAR